MAKQLWFTSAKASIHRGNNDANLIGTAVFWEALALSESRGVDTTGNRASSVTTVTGPTNGLEVIGISTVQPAEWISEPLSGDFTISGTVTANLWAAETSMNDNVAVNFVIEKIDGANGTLTQIVKSARITEEALTTPIAANFTATPTSTACKRGDRLRIRIYFDDAGTMASPGPARFYYDRSTASTAGDSWIQFTENLTFESAGDPPGPEQSSLGTQNANVALGAASGRTMLAQSFVSSFGTLGLVTAFAYKAGSPTDNMIVEVQGDSAGVPSGTVLGSVTTVAGSSLTTTSTLYAWNCNVALVVGTRYWIVFRRTGGIDSVNSFGLRVSSSSPTGWNAFDSWNGSTWTPETGGNNWLGLSVAGSVSTYYLTDTAETPISITADQAIGGNFYSVGAATVAEKAASQITVAPFSSVNEVDLWLSYSGTTPSDSIIIELWSDSSGSPGSFIGAVATVAGSSLTTTSTQYTFTGLGITGLGGAAFWIVCRRSGAVNGSSYYLVQNSSGLVSGWVGKTYNSGTSAWSVANNPFRISVIGLTANLTKKTLTTRGSGSTNSVTNATSGPVTPIQVTATSGGTAIEWYTPPLNAFSLGGKAKFNIRGLEAAATLNASLKAEIAITAGDGSGATVWGIANVEAITTYGLVGELNISDTAYFAWVSGDDTSISAGQRLRFRIFVDDCGSGALASGGNVTVTYNGATASAAGDTYVILPAAVTEQVPAFAQPIPMPMIGPNSAVVRAAYW
jgi:hypothetical protein